MAKELYSYDIVRLTRKERLPSSFISTEVHPIEGRGSRCVLVATLEIDSPWHHAREFGQQIISTLVREFVRSQSNSNLMRFEHALKLANHTISQAAEKLGVNVNCAVALFIEQEVHFTVIGNCRLLLFRNNALTDVTANDSGSSQFSSVTSGDLDDQEWLMVANQNVVPYLRQQAATIWSEQDPAALATELIEQAPPLERQNFFATLLRFRQDTDGQEQTVLWDDLEHTTPIRLPKISVPKVSIAPLVNAAASLRQSLVKLKEKRIKARPQMAESPTEESSPEIFDAREPLLSRIRIPRVPVKLPKLNRPFVIAAIVAVILVVVGFRVVSGRVDKANEAAPAPNLLEELQAGTAGEYKAFLETKFAFDRYLDLTSEQQQQFSQQLEQRGITMLLPSTVLAQIDDEIVAIDGTGQTIAAIDTAGQLWVVREGRTIKTEQSLLIQSPRSLAVVSSERIIVSDANSNLWLFDGSTTAQPIALTQPASLGTGAKIVQAYSGNLYVYAPETKTIFRQSAFDRELSALRSSGKFDQITSEVNDLTINGQLLAISDQGQIVGLQAARSVLNVAMEPSSAKTQLSSVEAQPNIALLSSRFLTVTSKTFTDKKEYFLASKSVPRDLVVDANTGSLWIAIGNEIYSVTP